MRRLLAVLILLVCACLLSPCWAKNAFTMTIPGIQANGPIPAKYSELGGNNSPEIRWSKVPAKTRSLVLICRDPDAKNTDWVHWMVAGISPNTRRLPENLKGIKGLCLGANDFDKSQWDGPMPPVGKLHHYYFEVFALDNKPAVKPGFRKEEIRQAMEGHILAKATYIGTFIRHK